MSPDVRAELERDPGRIPDFVHEVLRRDPPLHNTRRWLAQDAVIADQAMRAGDAVLVVLAAAERGPALDQDVRRSDMDGQDQRPFTFGRGAHACPGSAIAFTIAQAALETLLEMRVGFGELAMEHTYHPSINARIPRFAAARPAGAGDAILPSQEPA